MLGITKASADVEVVARPNDQVELLVVEHFVLELEQALHWGLCAYIFVQSMYSLILNGEGEGNR